MSQNLSSSQPCINLKVLHHIITIYLSKYSPAFIWFLDTYKKLSPNELFRIVSSGKYQYIDANGKVIEKTCPHLRHIIKGAYPNVQVMLNNQKSQIYSISTSTKDFDELHNLFFPMLNIDGVDLLMYYDTLLHLAWPLGITRGSIVYLHRGALKGFKMMFPTLKPDYKFGISINKLPIELQKLGPFHCENLFCLYSKGSFNNLNLKVSCTKVPNIPLTPLGICPILKKSQPSNYKGC